MAAETHSVVPIESWRESKLKRSDEQRWDRFDEDDYVLFKIQILTSRRVIQPISF